MLNTEALKEVFLALTPIILGMSAVILLYVVIAVWQTNRQYKTWQSRRLKHGEFQSRKTRQEHINN